MPDETLAEAEEIESELAFLRADLERFGPGLRSSAWSEALGAAGLGAVEPADPPPDGLEGQKEEEKGGADGAVGEEVHEPCSVSRSWTNAAKRRPRLQYGLPAKVQLKHQS